MAEPSGAKPKTTKPRCPVCGRPAVALVAPFCSRRCADEDLGRWLGGRYVIPGDETVDTMATDDSDDA